jgi:hypothetical protein
MGPVWSCLDIDQDRLLASELARIITYVVTTISNGLQSLGV